MMEVLEDTQLQSQGKGVVPSTTQLFLDEQPQEQRKSKGVAEGNDMLVGSSAKPPEWPNSPAVVTGDVGTIKAAAGHRVFRSFR
jgi:hypothetical protein